MPESEIGAGLRAVLIRHERFLDMQTRETLWFPVITVPSVVGPVLGGDEGSCWKKTDHLVENHD
jgi:hypothetical protein